MSTLAIQADNIFLAALPDERTAARMAAVGAVFRRRYAMSGLSMTPDRLHMSLASIDAAPSEAVGIAAALARNIEIASFDISFNRAQSFVTRTPKKPFVLVGDEGVIGARILRGQMLRGASRKAFEPHVTLCWDEIVVPPWDIAPIRWTVREIVLVRSLVGRSQHVHLARYPLRRRP